MVNTIGTLTTRRKYMQATLQEILKKAMVTQAICRVDESDNKTIDNPYGGTPTATVQAFTGTYSVTDFTLTNETLNVNTEFIYSEHIYDFENLLSNFDLFAERTQAMAYAVALAEDKWVLNMLCEDGTGTYSTPSGGFTTASNIITIMSNLLSKVAGYAEAYKGLFLVIESSDIVGFVAAQATTGYSMADLALKNGLLTSFMGVDIYVVRDSTFVSETLGTETVTNSGQRVFGVKGIATYAAPRRIRIEEKSVSGKTGKEIVVYGYGGFALWTNKATLIVDITVTA